jgi:Flp pilus assembly pilin Flp
MRLAIVVQQFWRDRRGQDMVEYALLAGFIAVAAGAAIPYAATPMIQHIFTTIEDHLQRVLAL